MKYLTLITPLLVGGVLGALLGYYGKCTSGACPLTANPWRGSVVGLFLGALVAFSIGCGNPPAEKDGDTADAATSQGEGPILHISGTDDFDARVLNAETLALVDFYADWCPPCRQLAPVVEEMAREKQGQMLVAKVNVDHNQDIAQRYGVRSIPHLVLFRDGKAVDTQTGFADQKSLDQWIGNHLK